MDVEMVAKAEELRMVCFVSELGRSSLLDGILGLP